MDHRNRAILEEYEGILEMHDEHEENIDLDDVEARALWERIEANLRRLSRLVSLLRRGRLSDDYDLEEVEVQIEELNDLYGELASLAWGDQVATR